MNALQCKSEEPNPTINAILKRFEEELNFYAEVNQNIESFGHRLSDTRAPEKDEKSPNPPQRDLISVLETMISRFAYINTQLSTTSRKLNTLV